MSWIGAFLGAGGPSLRNSAPAFVTFRAFVTEQQQQSSAGWISAWHGSRQKQTSNIMILNRQQIKAANKRMIHNRQPIKAANKRKQTSNNIANSRMRTSNNMANKRNQTSNNMANSSSMANSSACISGARSSSAIVSWTSWKQTRT